MKIILNYDFLPWNDYIRIERGNFYQANSVKQNEKRFVVYSTKGERYEGEYPVELIIRPHFKDKRRDLDNYRIKGLIDGLVAAGVIKNDNLTCVQKITLEPIFDKDTKVEVEIRELKEGKYGKY